MKNNRWYDWCINYLAGWGLWVICFWVIVLLGWLLQGDTPNWHHIRSAHWFLHGFYSGRYIYRLVKGRNSKGSLLEGRRRVAIIDLLRGHPYFVVTKDDKGQLWWGTEGLRSDDCPPIMIEMGKLLHEKCREEIDAAVDSVQDIVNNIS